MPEFTKTQFPSLYREFIDSGYLASLDGTRHLNAYEEGRKEGRLNYRSVLGARERGEDVTDLVLLKLLPYTNTADNREQGAWVHSAAPAIRGNIKKRFEGARWTSPEDWPAISDAILRFVERCNDDPEHLAETSTEFAQLPYIKGFHTGMLTPILNALRPEDYLLVDYKSRQTFNYFSGESYESEGVPEEYELVEGGKLEVGMLVRDIGGGARDGSVPAGENVVETITDVRPASPSQGREYVRLWLKRVDTGTQRTKYLSKAKKVVAKAGSESATRKTRSQRRLTGTITDYPEINSTSWHLIEEFAEEMDQPGAPALSDADRFDVFSHWLVAVREYPFPDRRYWKIAPGDKGWQWEECRKYGFIGIGWNDLGDVSGLSRAEFEVLQEKVEAELGKKKAATNQVWTFAHVIQEGDVIVANRGTSEVLGFGTVVGPHEFVPDARYTHQVPVRWDDTVPRRVDEKGWRRTLIEIRPEKYEELRAAQPLVGGTPQPEVEEAAPIEVERSYWWVNQGATYRQERDGGYLWAPKESKGGRVLGHHADLLRLREGDVALHYANGALRAASEVLEAAQEATKPTELPEGSWNTEGYLVRADYYELSSPVHLGELDLGARMGEEGGPFNQHGGVKQGYLYPLSEDFVERIVDDLPGRWPVPPMPEGREGSGGVWLFQANPKQWSLSERSRTARPGDEEEWTVTRYREDMNPGDAVVLWQGGPEAGIYATGTLFGEPFERDLPPWRDPRADGSTREWAIRFRYKRILPRPILKHELLKDPVLKDLQVIHAPQGTNFKVSEEEWVVLQALLEGPGGYDYQEPPFAEVASAIFAQGMNIEERDLRRYHLALKSRGFVVLSGVSGTGKTWLTEAYAKAVGAAYIVVPVAPNWTTNEDLLGYFNPLDSAYYDTQFSRFLRRAAREYERAQSDGRTASPYHLILDEMNLARVEYYFAKFLSAMELRARYGAATIELGPDEEVLLTPNLAFAGTVNVDETTHGFADKVYDRAQLIELTVSRETLREHLGDADHAEVLMEVWDVAHTVAPFAFRVLDEISAYVASAAALSVPWSEALDEQLLQKVLPKLKGADLRVGAALEGLVELTTRRDLPLSRAKTTEMLEEFSQHGFASYF